MFDKTYLSVNVSVNDNRRKPGIIQHRTSLSDKMSSELQKHWLTYQTVVHQFRYFPPQCIQNTLSRRQVSFNQGWHIGCSQPISNILATADIRYIDSDILTDMILTNTDIYKRADLSAFLIYWLSDMPSLILTSKGRFCNSFCQ